MFLARKTVSPIYPILLLILIGCSRKFDEAALRRIAILEDARTLNSGEFLNFFKHPDDIIRIQAAVAAGRIGDLKAVEGLVILLADSNREVGYEACFALGQLGDSSAVESLEQWFSRADSMGRGLALEALGKIGNGRAVSFLLARLNEGDNYLIPTIIEALVRAGASSAAPQIIPLLRSEDAAIRRAAAYFGYRISSPSMKDALLAALEDPDPAVRKYAAGGLGRLNDPTAARALVKLFDDSEIPVIIQAVRAAGKCGSTDSVPHLLSLLDSENKHIVIETIRALGALKDKTAIGKLESMSHNTSGWELSYLIKALTQIEGERFIPFLDTYSDHPDVSVRRATGESLAYVKSKKTIILAEDMMRDEDPTVRTAVISGIAVHGEDVAKVLLAGLSDEDWAVRMMAADALGKTGNAEYFDTIKLCLEANIGTLYTEELKTYLEAMFKLDQDKSLPEIRKFAGGRNSSLNGFIERIFAEAGEKAPPKFSPADADYPEDFGRLFGNPRVSLLTTRGRIEIELYGDEAQVVAASFLRLAQNRYYRDLIFHRVVADFVVQGGDPRGDGHGGVEQTLRDQINRHRFLRGTVGMPSSGRDMGSRQIFICLSDQPHLNGNYTVFGQVIRGWEALDRILEGDIINEVMVEEGEQQAKKFKKI